MIKKINILNHSEKVYIFFLIIFSLLINQYYGNLGFQPTDSLSHYDSSYRILNGELPFRDYWVVSGPFIDYVQSFLFRIFGVNWQTYVFHASLINSFLTLCNFFLLRSFYLKKSTSFLYSILLSILAYPISGTPFVDQHAAYFSLIGTYFLILAIKTEKSFFWYSFPFLFGFAFFSKIVPSSYTILSSTFIILFYSIINKKYQLLKYSSYSSVFFILFIFLILKLQDIEIYSLFVQYVFHPLSIGSSRVDNLNFSFTGFFSNFKFIFLSIIILFYASFKNILDKKKYFKEKNFYYFLIFLTFTFGLIFHQILTLNQTFIFFIIPVLLGFSHATLGIKGSNKKNINILLILVCIFVTTKYHLRFNETRKFHELNNVNLKLAVGGEKIHKSFYGLKWISTEFPNDPNTEIKLLNDIKKRLVKDEREKMLITTYSFFSVILKEKFFSPSRWYLASGQVHPVPGSKYFQNYSRFFKEKIKKNKIEVIYTIKPLGSWVFDDILGKNCLESSSINEILNIHLILQCDDLK
tara:strand:+ start:754 stop:2325 length:1572 start_codon:yes stop_codon:yes gene_type:complete